MGRFSSKKEKIDKILKKNEITLEDVLAVVEIITSSKVEKSIRKIVEKIKNKAKTKLILLPKVEPARSTLFDLVQLFSEL